MSEPQNHDVGSEITRRSADYHPSIWGDHFILYASDNMQQKNEDIQLVRKGQELKDEMKRMLEDPVEKTLRKLSLIDAIQRLGISYHFESETNIILKQLYDDLALNQVCFDDKNGDLYTVALCFRLLRQQGFSVSCEMFNKFKDSEGKFKEAIVSDVKGMLGLYEAAHLRVHGEEILDEALAFTTTHLQSSLNSSTSLLASQVNHALNRPLRKGLPRVEAAHYMAIYQQDPSHNSTLLTFSKHDFNLLQKVHQKELGQISKWWKDWEFSKKLPFARDRVVECYFWILGVYFEPEYALARRFLTKVIAMTSIIDDLYDVYGTFEEIQIFTIAVERWEISAKDQMPEYMKIIYQALLDVFAEADHILAPQGRSYRLHYAKAAMKNQVRAYFEEAKWYHENYIPTMDEYMKLALVTSAYPMLATMSIVGMGHVVTEESFDWLSSNPKIVKSSSIICRLMDDVVSHKLEQKRGHVVSAVQCYMMEHGGTEEEATKEFKAQIDNAWKDINEELLIPTAVPVAILMRIFNLSRVIDVIYKDEDGYTNAHVALKDHVTSLLINPLPLF